MSQNTDILNHLKNAPLTSLEALNKYGCFRLASRINDLRQAGHHIETKHISTPSGKSIAQYHLKERASA